MSLLLLLRKKTKSWIERNALLYDTFTTADAAPITSPRTCEPGPGTLTAVQTDGELSINGGALVFSAQSTPSWGDQGAHLTAQTRAAGLALLTPITLTTWEEMGIGWHTAAAVVDPDSAEHAIQANTTDGQLDDENGNAIISGLSTTVEYKLLQVLRDAGCFYILDGKLCWVSDTGSTGTLYPMLANLDAAGSLSDVSVSSLASYNAAWDGDWTEVTDEITNTPGEAFDAEADHHVRITFTYETGKYFIVSGRRSAPTLYGYDVYAQWDGDIIIRQHDGVTQSQLYEGAGLLSDGVAYVIDVVVEMIYVPGD